MRLDAYELTDAGETAAVTNRCSCGGTFHAVDGSYWEPPSTYFCDDCKRSDEEVYDQHDVLACDHEGPCPVCAGLFDTSCIDDPRELAALQRRGLIQLIGVPA